MSRITVDTITPEDTGNQGLDKGVKSSGQTGGATSITVQALLNGMSIGKQDATISGDTWSSNILDDFSPSGTLTIKAADPDGKVKPGEKSITLS